MTCEVRYLPNLKRLSAKRLHSGDHIFETLAFAPMALTTLDGILSIATGRARRAVHRS
jgi:hypothetical protein